MMIAHDAAYGGHVEGSEYEVMVLRREVTSNMMQCAEYLNVGMHATLSRTIMMTNIVTGACATDSRLQDNFSMWF